MEKLDVRTILCMIDEIEKRELRSLCEKKCPPKPKKTDKSCHSQKKH